MQHFVSLHETEMSQEEIDKYLQYELIKYMGGLSQFYGKRVLFDFSYSIESDFHPYTGTANIHTLKVDISDVNITRYIDIKPVPYIEQRKTRWERFKQFVKGE